MNFTKQNIQKIVDRALAGLNVTNYPTISISKTDFGTSIYIQNGEKKMRFSDHSVTNINRILGEEHYPISVIDCSDSEIAKLFSDDYKTLILKNGDELINFKRQVPVSEIDNWKSAKVFYKEIQNRAIRPEDFDKYEIIATHELTKKGDKIFCDVEVVKYSFGAYNVVTGEIDRTRFYILGEVEIEVNKF